MSNTRTLRRTGLCMALGLGLASLAGGPVLAQAVTGAVAGRADAGAQITVTNTATGQARSVTVNADGSYRVAQLPVGDYSLQVSRDGQTVGTPVSVAVSLGGTTTVNLGSSGNVTNLAS